MVERICPACQHGNPLDNRYCGSCGGILEQDAIVPRSSGTIVVAGQQLPVAQIKQVGTAIAVSLATIAAEAGLAWLRRRVERVGVPSIQVHRPSQQQLVRPESLLQDSTALRDTVTIVSQRVVEVWEQGGLTRQIIEKHVWRKEG